MVWSGRNSNLSENLWLPGLPARLKMIQSKVKALSSEQQFRHYKYVAIVFVAQGRVTPIWFKIELVWDFMVVIVTWRRSDPKWSRYPPDNIFPITSLWEILVAVETRVLIQFSHKTVYSLFPTKIMLYIKFHQDWPTGLRDIQVWKCGRWTTMTNDDGRSLLYYNLTLSAFDSGELKSE